MQACDETSSEGDVHVDRGWLKEDITLGPVVSDESSVRNQSDEPMHQGYKVHGAVRRLLFVTRTR